jgi:hypothetical protein
MNCNKPEGPNTLNVRNSFSVYEAVVNIDDVSREETRVNKWETFRRGLLSGIDNEFVIFQ